MKKRLVGAIVLGLSGVMTLPAQAKVDSLYDTIIEQSNFNEVAAYNLAINYLKGKEGYPKDVQKAAKLLSKVSDQLTSEQYLAQRASYILGYLYSGDEGHPKDDIKALLYFIKASEYIKSTKLVDAPFHVARLTGSDKQYIEYLQRSANEDYLPAILKLAAAYGKGERAVKNDEAYIHWLTKAAKLGHVEAQAYLGTDYFYGTSTYKDYDRAYYWLLRAAEKNNGGAQVNLGLLHELGLGREVNLKKARLWYERGTAQGVELAQSNLASLLLKLSAAQERRKGHELLLDLANKGVKSAAVKLSQLYASDELFKDPTQAQLWQQKAATMTEREEGILVGSKNDADNDEASYTAESESVTLYNKAMALWDKKEYEQAVAPLEQAARMNLPAAQLNLAVLYVQLYQKDFEEAYIVKAYGWAKIATNNGNEDAKSFLADLTEVVSAATMGKGVNYYYELNELLKERN